MPDFSQFIVNHWILWALLATLIGVFASMELVDKKFGLPQLMPYELIGLIIRMLQSLIFAPRMIMLKVTSPTLSILLNQICLSG